MFGIGSTEILVIVGVGLLMVIIIRVYGKR
jgi:hypothetical protein